MEQTLIGGVSRGQPWFEDGNIVLLTQDLPTAFRVHRGVLARHSEVFQSMLDIPQPPCIAETEAIEGCQVVEVYDQPLELSNMLNALYDGLNYRNRSIEDFFYLAGILRLSTKYFINRLRVQSIQHLTQTWSCTLKGHDEMVEAAINAPIVGDTTFPYVHPLHVLNLAREVNVNIVVPSALYFLSLYPLLDIIEAKHPKLAVDHPLKPSSMLSPTDIRHYTVMFQHRMGLILDFIRPFCSTRATEQKCPTALTCCRGFSKLVTQLSRSLSLRTGPLYRMMQAAEEISHDSTICEPCRTSFQKDVSELRDKIWNELPSIACLPSWSELEAMDLAC